MKLIRITFVVQLCAAVCTAAVGWAGEAAKAPALVKPVKMTFKSTGKMAMNGVAYLKSAEAGRVEIESEQMAAQMSMMLPGFGKKVIAIVEGKNAYFVSEALKTAVKMPEGAGSGMIRLGGVEKLASPDALKDLQKDGFKKSGTAKIGAALCDVWKGVPKAGKAKEGSKPGEATVWVRQKDQLPVKFEAKTEEGTMSGTAEWNPRFADSLFKVPAGYKTTDMAEIMGKMGKAGPGKAPGGTAPGGKASGKAN